MVDVEGHDVIVPCIADPGVFSESVYSSYTEEWKNLFCEKNYFEKIKNLGIEGHLHSSHFRSICWQLYLDCLPKNPSEWISAAELLRNKYEKIVDKLRTNPRSDINDMDLVLNNPLSQSQQSPWNQYFLDEELKTIIAQDVVRTFPEVDFFHSEQVQNMMVNILFCYAREFPKMSYRQGMHELLAPILYVLHCDQQAYLNASHKETLRMDFRVLLNQNYTEHDAFSVFCQLMEVVGEWYIVNECSTSMYKSNLNVEPFVHDYSHIQSNALGVKLIKIYAQLLKHHDFELFSHLEEMEIAPQIYGIRWLRLLFGREFPFQDLLLIWDTIFANSFCLDLVDYIFIAMLIAIRNLLLSSDYTACLNYLMRYPSVADVHTITDLALHLKDPVKYAKPEICVAVEVPKTLSVKTIHGLSISVNEKQFKPSKITEKISNLRPKNLSFMSNVNRSADEQLEPVTNLESDEESCQKENIDDVCVKHSSVKRFHTLPRSSAHSIMEPKNIEVKSKNFISPKFGHFKSEKNSSCLTDYKEMVSLVPHPCQKSSASESLQRKSIKATCKEKCDELSNLKEEIRKLKSINSYCCQRMTEYLEVLQRCMVHQELQHEDDMLVSLAGLKRVRDILKGGTTGFYMEINDNEASNNFRTREQEFDLVETQKPISCNDLTVIKNSTSKINEELKDEHDEKKVQECKTIPDNLEVSKICRMTELTQENNLKVAKKELCKLFLGSLNENSNAKNDLLENY